jgi:hypothetical protein
MTSPQCVIKENSYSPELFGFEEILKSIEEAIEKSDSGVRANIAVIAEPFSGRSELLYKISELCRERESKLFFNRLVSDEKFLDTLEKSGDIVLVDNCHLLHSRRIGGFEKLDLFLNTASSSEKLFITTWNQFSWNFLRFVFPLERVFPVRIELPRLGAQELKKMVMSTCEWQMTFAEEEATKKEKWLQSSEFSADIKPFKRTLKIPVPMIDYFTLKSRILEKVRPSEQKKEETSVEDKVFQRLRDASDGNPGIANAIWMRSIPRAVEEIKPGDIIKRQYKIDLSYDQAFLLYLILCMERVSVEELKSIMDPCSDVHRFAHELERIELISVENGLLSIMPEALHSIESYLKSVRLVW